MVGLRILGVGSFSFKEMDQYDQRYMRKRELKFRYENFQDGIGMLKDLEMS